MDTRIKKDLILSFINGPLKKLLTGKISFSRFKESVNEVCGTDFIYSDLYPSYLFNAHTEGLIDDSDATKIVCVPKLVEEKYSDFNEKMQICHQYGLCIQSSVPLAICGFCSVCPRDKSEGFFQEEKE
jgi:hypothetical protein